MILSRNILNTFNKEKDASQYILIYLEERKGDRGEERAGKTGKQKLSILR